MRTLAPTTCLLALLLLSGCAAGTPTADSTSTTTPHATRAPTATPTPSAPAPEATAPLTEPEQLDKQTKTAVSLYSEIVCSNLANHPEIDLNAAVDKVLASYATEGLSEASRLELAQRVLEQSAAASCPDQSERVAAELTE